ncbi:MAG: hypothetical protein WAV76_11645 [Bacteroidota bacterium]
MTGRPACGKPVIEFAKGALETVVGEGRNSTGIFFRAVNRIAARELFENRQFKPGVIR